MSGKWDGQFRFLSILGLLFVVTYILFVINRHKFIYLCSDPPNAAAGWGDWCDFLKFRLNPVFGPGFVQLNMGCLG